MLIAVPLVGLRGRPGGRGATGPLISHDALVSTRDHSRSEKAPHMFTYQKRFAAPPDQVWEQLTSDASIAARARPRKM